MSSKLSLEDCCEDSPRTRALIKVFEQDCEALSSYADGLSHAVQRIVDAQNELNVATQMLSKQVRGFEKVNFSLHDDDDFIQSAFQQLASKIDQVASFNSVLYTQLSENVLYYVARFVAKDLAEFSNLKSKFQSDDKIHAEAVKKLLRLSKRKLFSNEVQWQEASDHLHAARQGFHTTSMAYCSQLNMLQEKKKIGLLQPLVGYVQSQMSFFKMGNELCQPDLDQFLDKLSQSIADIENNISTNIKEDQVLQDKLDAESTRFYIPDPPPSMDLPELPVKRSLTQISGYLFVRSRTAFISQWNQQYFFTQCGNLMQQGKHEVAGGLVIDLDSCMVAHADVDDRRNVFQVTSKEGKHTIYLQAESKYYSELWIATLENISAGKYLGASYDEKDESGTIPKVVPSLAPKLPAPVPKTSTDFEEKHEAFRPSAMFDRIKNAATQLMTPKPKTPSASESPSHDDSTANLEAVLSQESPVLFDLPSPADEPKQLQASDGAKPLESPQERSNPFSSDKMEELSLQDETESNRGANYRAMYVVRFIGCQQVNVADNGAHGTISDTIRSVMASRALHNVFSMNELHLVVKNEMILLVDPATQLKRDVFSIREIIHAANHRENTRLFGFIVQHRPNNGECMCYAFESNSDAADICCAIATAQVMVQSEIEYEESQKQKSVEMQLEAQSKLIAHSSEPPLDGAGDQNEVSKPQVGDEEVAEPEKEDVDKDLK